MVSFDLPPVARSLGARAQLAGHLEVTRRGTGPVEERLPQLPRLLPVHSLTHHRQLERVVRSDLDLLAPVRIEETRGVGVEESREQSAEGFVQIGRASCRER